jgi:hypothetical protein
MSIDQFFNGISSLRRSDRSYRLAQIEMGIAYNIDFMKLKNYKPGCGFNASELTAILR